MPERRDLEPEITLTGGSIRVRRHGEKILTILPLPVLPSAQNPSDFIVDLDSVLRGDPPHENIEIEIAELPKIVQAIEAARLHAFVLRWSMTAATSPLTTIS